MKSIFQSVLGRLGDIWTLFIMGICKDSCISLCRKLADFFSSQILRKALPIVITILILATGISFTIRTTYLHQCKQAESTMLTYFLLWETEDIEETQSTYLKISEEWAQYYGNYQRAAVKHTHLFVYLFYATISAAGLYISILFLYKLRNHRQRRRILAGLSLIACFLVLFFSFFAFMTLRYELWESPTSFTRSLSGNSDNLCNKIGSPIGVDTNFGNSPTTDDMRKYPPIDEIIRSYVNPKGYWQQNESASNQK